MPRTDAVGWLRRALLALAAASLVAGVAGGLLRLGVPVPLASGRVALSHGVLMLGGFFGTVIALERAIALGGRSALLVPAAAAAAAVGVLAGAGASALVLLAAASAGLVALGAAIVRRQRADHTLALLAGALAWLVGNLALLAGATADAVAAWWFTFIVLTVAAERLELARLRPRHALARPTFAVSAALLVGGAAAMTVAPPAHVLFAAGLLAIALWLAVFDVAWRTLRAGGYARYAACALLAGYAWLAIAALAWAAPAAAGLRDVALHAIGLGFACSMIFAHAPLIVPVVTRVQVRFTVAFYAPLLVLHASLAWRVAAGWHHFAARQQGAILDAAALVLFAVVLLASCRARTGARTASTKAVRHTATPRP
jgi:hypothetical protein